MTYVMVQHTYCYLAKIKKKPCLESIMLTKSGLAIKLSRLKTFSSPKLLLEQYPTDSEIAAEVLWIAYMKGDVEGKIVADFGCGTGILGIGCLLLGAKRVYFVDSDGEALSAAAENLNSLRLKGFELIKSGISKISLDCDVVVQNPPFGTKRKHADRVFLLKAFSTACVIYSIHKASSTAFIEKLSRDNGFMITDVLRCRMPLKSSFSFHKRRLHRIDAACFRLEKA